MAKLKNFLLLVAKHSPMVGVAAAWWTDVLRDPLITAGLAIGYEALMFFWKELGKPVWAEVWEKEFKPQTITALKDAMTYKIIVKRSEVFSIAHCREVYRR